MTDGSFKAADALPTDWREGRFLGRIASSDGPTPVLIAGGVVHDMAKVAPTVSALVEDRAFDESAGQALGDFDALGIGTSDDARLRLLRPIDLQCVKAAGVTFAVSALERVIEEKARGDAGAAAEVRGRLEGIIGGSLRAVVPGSS